MQYIPWIIAGLSLTYMIIHDATFSKDKLIERLTRCESSIKSAHKRIDLLERRVKL
jgi:hypothetical protein